MGCLTEKICWAKRKLFVDIPILSTNIDIVKIFVLHNKVALLTRDVLSGEQEIVTKDFLEKFYQTIKLHIESIDQKINFYDPDETEIRLPFLQIFLNILECIWWSLHSSFLFMVMGKRWHKVIYLCHEITKSLQSLNLGSFNKILLSRLADFGCLRVWGLGWIC